MGGAVSYERGTPVAPFVREQQQTLLLLGFGFRGGLVFKAHRLSVSLNSRLESNKEEGFGFTVQD